MPANFTKGQRELLYAKRIETGYALIQEVGLKRMSIALITKRVHIATGTFYHFFDSKEAFVQVLIDYQNQQLFMELKALVERHGKRTLKQVVSFFCEAIKMENNFLMRLTLEDWVWLKTHLASHGLFNEN